MRALIELSRLVKAEYPNGDYPEYPTPVTTVELTTKVLYRLKREEARYIAEGNHSLWKTVVAGVEEVRRVNLLDMQKNVFEEG